MPSKDLVRTLDEVITPDLDNDNTWQYDNCEVSELHINAFLLPPSKSNYIREHFEASDGQSGGYLGWMAIPSMEFGEDAVDLQHNMTTWIRNTIREIPGGVEITRDVDGGGFTEPHTAPKMFSRWVPVNGSTYARFSESRSAMHNSMMTTKGGAKGGVLRSPVMNGVVLEATNKPESLDPRDAVSLVIYEFGSGSDPTRRLKYGYDPKPGAVYDMTSYTEKPYFVGPLYNGHPNKVEKPEDIWKVLNVARDILKLSVDQELRLIGTH